MDIFTLTCAKLPADTRVMRLSGYEGISQLYNFTLELVIPGQEGLSFDMAEAVDASATLHIHGGDGSERSVFHGVLAEVDWVQEVADSSVYRVVLVPRLWRLGLSQHSSVYPDKTLQAIVKEVMEANGFKEKEDYAFDLGPAKYEKLPHVAQYRESDLAFLFRRFEREGLYFYFEQLDTYEKLIITDDKGKAKKSGSVQYFPLATEHTAGAEGFTSFVCRHQARAKQVRVREYDYLRPTANLKKFDTVSDAGTVNVLSHDENYTVEADGQRLATVRAQELKSREVLFEARGHTFDVKPGYLFELTHHPRPSFSNALYLAVSVIHEGSQGVTHEGARVEEPPTATYTVRVEAIPEAVQYRPGRVTPVPRIYGTEMAIVDGEQNSPYAQIDQHGRYRVQVFFDEHEPRPGKASMWVRMLQPHGGAHEGFHFPLRKGTEVMLVFLGGDPDRPVIAGMVPNTDTPSPVTEENASQNVILTGGGTRIEIEDNDGSQYLRMSTPPESTSLHMGAADDSGNHVHLVTLGNSLTEVGGDRVVRVDKTQTEEVHGDVTENYGAKQTTTIESDHKREVHANEEIAVTGNQQVTVQGNQTMEVTGDRVLRVSSNQRHEITANDEHAVTGDQAFQVTGNQLIEVTGSQTIDVTGGLTETISTSLTQTTNGTHTTTVNGAVTSTINGPLTQTISGGALITSPAGYKVVAPSSWFKVTGASGELVGAKIGIVAGIKTDHALLAITGGGAKLDTIGFKADFAKVAYKNNPLTIQQASTKLKNAAIGLYMYGLTIFS